MGERLIQANINHKWDAHEIILLERYNCVHKCLLLSTEYKLLSNSDSISLFAFTVLLPCHFLKLFHCVFPPLFWMFVITVMIGKGKERNHLFQKAWDLSWFYIATLPLLTAVTWGHYICEQEFQFLYDGKHSVLWVIYRWYTIVCYQKNSCTWI